MHCPPHSFKADSSQEAKPQACSQSEVGELAEEERGTILRRFLPDPLAGGDRRHSSQLSMPRMPAASTMLFRRSWKKDALVVADVEYMDSVWTRSIRKTFTRTSPGSHRSLKWLLGKECAKSIEMSLTSLTVQDNRNPFLQEQDLRDQLSQDPKCT